MICNKNQDVLLQAEIESPLRIDRWLTAQLPDYSRSHLQKLIEAGQVWLNDRPCRSKKDLVQRGDWVRLHIPEAEPLQVEAEPIPLDILYEDDQLLILNKPAGLVVHPAPGHYQGTLVNALLHHCQDLAGIGGVLRPGIVHRLDKDTTGVMVVAKTDRALQHLQDQIRSKTAGREYFGVVYGAPAAESGTVEQPLGRHPQDRTKMAIVPLEKGGRTAVTHWQRWERLGNYSLLHFRLETGRTHQIRVHSAFLGHPIVGDPQYSAGRSPGIKLSGQALHAWRLSLLHPVSGEAIVTTAPLPQDFQKLLKKLGSQGIPADDR
ncbi:MAG: RluA family pseudouridine synthase [Prochlorotrichaceae cyanobacterium]|jgi:23S rRNA pseudouridine1911/1915/1917 synthase